jgi:hypothetical protein
MCGKTDALYFVRTDLSRIARQCSKMALEIRQLQQLYGWALEDDPAEHDAPDMTILALVPEYAQILDRAGFGVGDLSVRVAMVEGAERSKAP